jgi:alpha/beta superfamily hydrolase
VAAIQLIGPAGRLEALHESAPEPTFAALVCHPHPQLGGTMHNHATYRLARAARLAGGAVLRFNFRGVGASEGRYDGGRGEADDAAAALAALAARHPGLPRLACGFSFGAFAALRAGSRDAALAGLVLAGLAVRPAADLPRDLGPLRATPRPIAVIQAADDQFGAPPEVEAALFGSAGPRRLAVVASATHLFTEALDELEAAARDAVAWVLAGGR